MNIALQRTLCLPIAILGASHSFAQIAPVASIGVGSQFPAAPGWGVRGGLPPPGLIASPWGCYPGTAGCIDPSGRRLSLERQRRFDALRQEPANERAGASSSLWLAPPAPRYLPPPTSEDQIQPAYRDSSVVRPEFRDAGTPIQAR